MLEFILILFFQNKPNLYSFQALNKPSSMVRISEKKVGVFLMILRYVLSKFSLFSKIIFSYRRSKRIDGLLIISIVPHRRPRRRHPLKTPPRQQPQEMEKLTYESYLQRQSALKHHTHRPAQVTRRTRVYRTRHQQTLPLVQTDQTRTKGTRLRHGGL